MEPRSNTPAGPSAGQPRSRFDPSPPSPGAAGAGAGLQAHARLGPLAPAGGVGGTAGGGGRWGGGDRVGGGPPHPPVGTAFMRRMAANIVMGPLNRQPALNRQLSQPEPPPSHPEPEHAEAFVEEPGIKLYESRPPTDADDDDEDDDEAGDGEDSEEDPLYDLDVMDDTIVEEGEDEDDDDDKTEQKKAEVTTAEAGDGEGEAGVQQSEGDAPAPQEAPRPERSNSSSSASSSNNSSGNVSTATVALGTKSTGGSVSSSSSGGGVNFANKRDSCSSGSSRDSGVSESWLPPDQQAFTRGRPGRLSLPATSRHQFTIRRVAEAEAPPARRTSDYIDLRLVDMRSPESSSVQVRPSNAMVWVKRQTDTTSGGGKSQQLEGSGEGGQDVGSRVSGISSTNDGTGVQGSVRPRSGTWSVANSRRVKIKAEKEEEASLRQRRKSGDDILAATSSNASNVASGRRKEGGPQGFFDSFRPRSKSDARAILAARQRRKSGDDVLNSTAKEKEKKKEASPGFFDYITRPRSKSDASSRLPKKPNLMTTMKNAVQHTLVSPSNSTRGGRRSGDATPVEQTPSDDVYHTWHAGAPHPNLQIRNRTPDSSRSTPLAKVMELFRSHRESPEERQRRKSGGKYVDKSQMRRHSSDLDKRRHGSGTLQHSYMRGEMDPNQAAILFRDSRGLPAADPFLDNISRSDLEQDESQIFVKFFKFHHTYDLIPLSAKLVVFDTKLQVKKAFFALVYNGVRAAPLWDSTRQEFVGMLTITDFIRILQNFYQNPNRKMEELEDHRLETWRIVLKDESRPLISIRPDESLYVAIRSLIHHKIHRLPVIDPVTGNVLYIVTHKRILKFLYLYINELPKPSILQKPLRDMNIGTYSNIQTASQDTLIIEALDQFVDHRVSALPIVDTQGKLVDIYAKFDVINLAAEGTYNNLDVTLRKANEYRNKWFEEVHRCTLDETLGTIMERIVRAEVHRLVVVDEEGKVKGVISLSDILKELVLKPCLDEEPNGLQSTSVTDMEVVLSATDSSDSSFKAPGEETTEPPVKNSVDPNENFPTEVNNEPIEGSPEPEVTINGVAKEIEDNVDGKWSSNDRLSQHCNSSSSSGMVEQDAAKASPADSEEDEWRYSVADADDPPQAKVIPITG